ncbi:MULTISPECIES: MBL fold metallo-hydrolase [Culturomica]|jgi:L-ascorbate metabolism protein UlaG (beta-lactamase superfamily)|uniref:MBL fold metallo-hydrolase n=1 Tax=Culturomica TaxID=1926651 RepID=UPI000E55F0F3|nr:MULTISPECIES: MBL fold metallo-hydrolase [Odoribacteraceae]RHV98306.1 MBL fold metallo-hydrolase [Odoribacter sp. OF09-27XD]HBO26599.1 hydrolase [Culturomica sp.]
MKLIYVYHSGFILENDNIVVVIDYYKDSGWKGKEGTVHEYLRNTEKRMYILASHAHPDHFNPEIFGWSEKKNLRYILSSDIRKGNKEWEDDVVWLDKGETWQDDFLRIKAYGSTDVGISFLLHTEGKRIFHAGDLNNWHWREESTEQEVEEAEKAFLREVAVLAKDADFLDLAMFPVDPRLGADYMSGAKQFIDRIPVRKFVPMHFWERYEKANAFREYAENHGTEFIVLTHPGMSVEF